MKKALLLTIALLLLCGTSVFAEPITSTGTITRLYTYSTADEDVYVLINSQGYWIDKYVPNFSKIYAQLLAAHASQSTIEIMGEILAPWHYLGQVSETVYKIYRVSILH